MPLVAKLPEPIVRVLSRQPDSVTHFARPRRIVIADSVEDLLR